jgi:hypothetical protein
MIQNGFAALVETLLASGAEVTAKDKAAMTALHLAVSEVTSAVMYDISVVTTADRGCPIRNQWDRLSFHLIPGGRNGSSGDGGVNGHKRVYVSDPPVEQTQGRSVAMNQLIRC